MSVSLEYLQHCSAQTGFAIDPLEKVVRLGELAADIMRHPFLGRVLALKGGTALNLCLGPPQRLSVDLDFNYIGHLERDKMLADRPQVEKALVQLASRKSYRIQQSADAFAGRKIYLIYQSVTGHNDRVEVDLNFLFRMPVAGTMAQGKGPSRPGTGGVCYQPRAMFASSPASLIISGIISSNHYHLLNCLASPPAFL